MDMHLDAHRYFVEVMLDQFDGTDDQLRQCCDFETGRCDYPAIRKIFEGMIKSFIKHCADKQIKMRVPPEDFVVYAFAEGFAHKLSPTICADMYVRMMHID